MKRAPLLEPVSTRAAATPSLSPPGWIERHLVLLMPLAMAAGVCVDRIAPGWLGDVAGIGIRPLSVPLAVLSWAAIMPAMMSAELGARAGRHADWRGVGIVLFVGGVARPVSMALLAAIMLAWVLRPLLPAAELPAYVAGLTLLAAGPPSILACLWSGMAGADQRCMLLQMSLGAGLATVTVGPIIALLLDMPPSVAPSLGMASALVAYLAIPAGIARLLGRRLRAARGDRAMQAMLSCLRPWSLAALLLMLALVSGMAAVVLVDRPLIIALLALPLACQVYLNAGQAVLMGRLLDLPYDRMVPAALIGASGSATIGAAFALGTADTGPGTATVVAVGLLAEMPLGLSVALALDACRTWYGNGRK